MDKAKMAAAAEALNLVRRGMKVGLGTGSTAEIFIELLGQRNREERLELLCIATSKASQQQAKGLGLRMAGFDRLKTLDIAFDGADQVDSRLNLVKGLGGALVREKIVDYRAKTFVVMVGENKLVSRLSGTVPVEVIPMAEHAVKQDLLSLGARRFETRMNGRRKFISDNHNLILHAEFGPIADPQALEERINGIPGSVDNGIFAHKRPLVIVGSESGKARALG